jgi:hypothetical protein
VAPALHLFGLRKALDLHIPFPHSADIQASRLEHLGIKARFDT